MLNFRHRHTKPRTRQDLEALASECAERATTFEAKYKELREARDETLRTLEKVESQRDEALEERMETFQEKAELSNENTRLTNKVEELKPFQKKCDDLKWQLEKIDKKEDYMKGLESKCRRMEKQLAKAKEDQDDSKSLQIVTETELETLERIVKEKDEKLEEKENEIKAARRTRHSDEVAVKKAHRMVFLLSAKAHKERRSALQAQRMYRQAKQEAQHHAATTHQGDAPTPHECDHSPYLRTIGLQADTIATLRQQSSTNAAAETAVVAAVAEHVCDHSECDRRLENQKQTTKDSDDKVDKLQSALDSSESARKNSDLLAENHKRKTTRLDEKVDNLESDLNLLQEEYKKLQSTVEDDFEGLLDPDNEEVKDEAAIETPEVPPGDLDADGEEDQEEPAAKEALEVALSAYSSDVEEDQEGPATEVPGVALPAAHEVPLPEATDADIEGQQSLLLGRDATIDQLQATLKDEEARRKGLEAKIADHVCDHSRCSSQANEKDGLIQELGKKLATQKQCLDGRIQELDDELVTQKQRLEGHIQELEEQLIARKQSEEEVNTRLKTCREEKETALASLNDERKAREKDRQLASLSTSKGNEVGDLKKELSATKLQCEGLQQSLADKDTIIASLNGDISKASNQFNNLKQSVGMASDYGITEVESELKRWKVAFEGLSHEARTHVCDHSQCVYNRSQLEIQITALQHALDDAGRNYADLEKTAKEMDMAIKRRNAQRKSMQAADKEKEEKHLEMKNKLLRDIEVAKGQAGLRYETNQPGYRPLRDQMLAMKATLDAVKQDLDKTAQALRERTGERDHERKCALGFKEDSERFAASAKQEQAAYLNCMKARDELANQKQCFEQETERLRVQMAELAKKNSDLAIEVANHTTKATPSGRKRGVDAEEDEPKKKGRADV